MTARLLVCDFMPASNRGHGQRAKVVVFDFRSRGRYYFDRARSIWRALHCAMEERNEQMAEVVGHLVEDVAGSRVEVARRR